LPPLPRLAVQTFNHVRLERTPAARLVLGPPFLSLPGHTRHACPLSAPACSPGGASLPYFALLVDTTRPRLAVPVFVSVSDSDSDCL
jgi:hypothetical protein